MAALLHLRHYSSHGFQLPVAAMPTFLHTAFSRRIFTYTFLMLTNEPLRMLFYFLPIAHLPSARSLFCMLSIFSRETRTH